MRESVNFALLFWLQVTRNLPSISISILPVCFFFVMSQFQVMTSATVSTFNLKNPASFLNFTVPSCYFRHCYPGRFRRVKLFFFFFDSNKRWKTTWRYFLFRIDKDVSNSRSLVFFFSFLPFFLKKWALFLHHSISELSHNACREENW